MTPYPKLQEFFYNTDHGKDILKCIQCGTCSGSCPFTDQMDYAPRGLFALIRDGEMDEVLKSNTMWFCSSCYQCVERCP
ncbi:MAG: 4Fe-4S dicluster domain-containing protein, partial [Deltaproteobacteria bacterium]|nr:4Fe-4S dicluster domain-containing protein [Deltaproteobacteria bacterium]